MITYIEYFSGCLGGIGGVLVGQPLDTIKVRLQTQTSQNGVLRYRGVFHCFTSIVKNEGYRGLFKGMSSPLLGLSFINAIVFGVEAQTTAFLGKETTLTHMLGGAFAGAIQCFVCSPMELAKTQMQVQGIGTRKYSHSQYKNSIDCLLKIYKKHGIVGCYRGMSLTLIRETPAFAFYFATYDILTTTVLKVDKTETYKADGIAKMMLAGGFSGIAAWVCTYPADVIKSRFQADEFAKNAKYKGSIDCLIQSYKKEGVRILFRGLSSTILRAFPVNAATFAIVQVSSQYLYRKVEERKRIE